MNKPDDKTKFHLSPQLTVEDCLPCKKCGSKMVGVTEHQEEYAVICYDCQARTARYNSETHAVRAWNHGITLNRKQRRQGR